ncbi:TPM domain-containing protein [Caviibacterium pharyngocola]|uniref:TPM domain-containing protein n=1 Tax=Caviibacterium pharyngocola TaxID=28159 RepID=A0A2M8RUU0_9PAST|nr:TPM domain-containing protein [Caviibacterium pharyngocola]PJG82654.1 hypothetical protein CVP04_07570 [Caviibacterium pharyngocola]
MGLFSGIPFDKQQIEAAIYRLELLSSAELRVYIERNMPKTDRTYSAVERALQVFDELEMTVTQARNGVLIYIAYKDHQCAIIGDQGIHQYVGDEFWRSQCELMIDHFKQNQYTQGVIAAIEQSGKKLAEHFPVQPDDKNELDNEVIIND